MRILLGLKSINFRRLALALAVAIAGGVLFASLDLPMPWMLGPLLACLLGSLLRLPIEAPASFRPPLSAVLGVVLGSAYSPDLLGQISNWWITVLGLIAFMLVGGGVCIAYFRLIARYDPATAYFAGMPGGLAEMVLMGESLGADLRKVALVHSLRITVTVFSIPFLMQWLQAAPVPSTTITAPSLTHADPIALGWFASTYIVGIALAKMVTIPARYLLAPLLVSVIVHVTGISSFQAPAELVIIAQIGLGTIIGCRFAGSAVRELLVILVTASGSTALLISVSLAFAWAISLLSPYRLPELFLAYSPGGLAEMGLMALALNLEVALVSAHHILRIALVSVGATALLPLSGIKPTKTGM